MIAAMSLRSAPLTLLFALSACHGAGEISQTGAGLDASVAADGSSSSDARADASADSVVPVVLPAPSCTPRTGGGRAEASSPVLRRTLSDRWHESWLASPAVADLDGDGTREIVLARAGRLLVYHPDGALVWSFDVPSGGRIWASPVVADLAGDGALEVAFAARERVFVLDARGRSLPGFPYAWRDELRSLAAGDLDGDGRLELVTLTTKPVDGTGTPRDILLALRGDGSVVSGWPPNTTRSSGCDEACYVTGGYDQNVALGPLDGDARWDVLGAQDNAYLSWHRGDGSAFDAAPIFQNRRKVLGVRFLHDYALAQQGWANDEQTANQAHFTNSAPAIADLDGDGQTELVLTASVQNASQTERERGVALWVLHADATRPSAWQTPHLIPTYLAGLWDFEDTNIVGMTNQVTVAELDPASPGLELLFAGFDGGIHLVTASNVHRWRFGYTTDADVLTAGLVVGDLSGDGVPEIVFATYSPRRDASALYIVGADGALQHRVALPARGAMSVPTLADVDGDGSVEIVLNLKDGEDRLRNALLYSVPDSHTGCLLWPTGRANLLRNGYVPTRR